MSENHEIRFFKIVSIWLGVIAAVGIGVFLLLPFDGIRHGGSPRPLCLNNTKQFALAIQNYTVSAGKYPPLFSTDENGKPLHSWRVLILPYIEYDNLYKAIDLTKPWDHPDNLEFHGQMPGIFRCPSSKSPENMTGYLAISGEETIWDPTGKSRESDQIVDGLGNTILLIESKNNLVNWMQPTDMDFETALRLHGEGSLLSGHDGGSNVAFADGSATFLDKSDSIDLRGMLTINGGETIER